MFGDFVFINYLTVYTHFPYVTCTRGVGPLSEVGTKLYHNKYKFSNITTVKPRAQVTQGYMLMQASSTDILFFQG